MPSRSREVRDPIHVFARLGGDESKLVDSAPFQRLRHIHQLALTYLVYPGATHKRFEHSLGVMELAGRIFDIVTDQANLTDEIRRALPPVEDRDEVRYWRRVLRLAALCHDIGHLPFSHAGESELLPEGWDHERLTLALIESDEMAKIWNEFSPPVRVEHIAKIAVGPKKAKGLDFTHWEAILSEIITGDAFGADRIDYLLRDSHHVGVAYGRFDHYRLIDTMRILIRPEDEDGEAGEPELGIEEGGIQSAEALMLARYLMYSQVYLHPIRRIYDIHLVDFFREWLNGGMFPTNTAGHLAITDNEATARLLKAAGNVRCKGHRHARRIVNRQHFKRLYQRSPNDKEINPEAGTVVFDALKSEFGGEHFRFDQYRQRAARPDFPVRRRDGPTASSLSLSQTLNQLPAVAVDQVYSSREKYEAAHNWLADNRYDIIKIKGEQ